MKYEIIQSKGITDIAHVLELNAPICDGQSVLDMLMTIAYENNAIRVILPKELLCESFFDLRTKVAGEVLQKVSNYRMKLAIVGDFSIYDSKALQDFIYECNTGHDVFFVKDLAEAIQRLREA